MGKRRDDLEGFLREVETESKAAGPQVVEAMTVYGEHFRLARQLISLRKKRGWTQQQLSKASGVQQSEISRIERGQGNPTYRTLDALARAGDMAVLLVPRRLPASGRRSKPRAAAR